MKKLKSIADLLDHCHTLETTQTASEAMRGMCEVYADCPEATRLGHMDPFAPEYRQAAMALYGVLADVKAYDPWVNERTPYIDLSRVVSCPTPYQYDSATVSDFVLSWGWILRNIDVRQGSRVLEYGAGEGQVSIALARMGCDVSIIDIDERYLEAVQTQCNALGVSIRTQKGQFGDAIEGKQFDRIIFYEAFHHAFEHAEVLRKLHGLLAPGGFILMAGEPIIEPGHPFIPFPWGPRLDGISVRSTRRFGWCELGFQRPYFIERLMRSGYTTQYLPCPVTARGDCYIARPIGMNLALGDPFDIAVHADHAGWSGPEGAHRWTSYRALLPVPETARAVDVRLANYLPVHRSVVLRSGGAKVALEVASGEVTSMRINVKDRLEISASGPRTDIDPRELGVAVQAVTFL
jgi:SAM-dependent methyltransferase